MSTNRRPDVSRRSLLKWAAAGAAASVVPYTYLESGTRWLSFETFDLPLPRWDAGPFRATVLSDVHVNSPREFSLSLEAADLALSVPADVILMPGDFLNYSDKETLGYLRGFLAAFDRAKCPAYATMGNHDYSAHHPQFLIDEFARSPVRLLRNETVDLGGVSIAGLDDALAGLYRPDILVPGEHSKSLLTMLHEPDFVDELPSHISLLVSGHSHGGQICLPFGIPVHTPFGARRYIDGFYSDAKAPVFVTRGVGTMGPPYRMFCRPQVAQLTLHAEQA